MRVHPWVNTFQKFVFGICSRLIPFRLPQLKFGPQLRLEVAKLFPYGLECFVEFGEPVLG